MISPATAVVVPAGVLQCLEAAFREAGSRGLETTAMLMADPGMLVVEAVVPDQIASPEPRCWVEVTEQGKLDLAVALRPDHIYVARIHCHPRSAFHSKTDDANPSLAYEGALSIVAPNFGAGLGRGLSACAVYRRSNGAWHELPPGPTRDRHIRVHG